MFFPWQALLHLPHTFCRFLFLPNLPLILIISIASQPGKFHALSKHCTSLPVMWIHSDHTFHSIPVSVMLLESSPMLNAIHLIHEQANKAHRQN